jgi:hypothetical protein
MFFAQHNMTIYWILVIHRFNYKILGGTEGRSRIVTIEDWRENELEVGKHKTYKFIKRVAYCRSIADAKVSAAMVRCRTSCKLLWFWVSS